MSEPTRDPDAEAVAHAAAQGASRDDIRQTLESRGLSPERITELLDERQRIMKMMAARQVFVGSLLGMPGLTGLLLIVLIRVDRPFQQLAVAASIIGVTLFVVGFRATRRAYHW